MPRVHLIDPPSPWAPLDEWKAHLADLLEMRKRGTSTFLEDAIQTAEREIAKRS